MRRIDRVLVAMLLALGAAEPGLTSARSD